MLYEQILKLSGEHLRVHIRSQQIKLNWKLVLRLLVVSILFHDLCKPVANRNDNNRSITFCWCPGGLNKYTNEYTKTVPQMYPNIFKISKIYQIHNKYQAAEGPAQAQGRARAGPGPARPLAWAGPAAAWCDVIILYTLDTFEYILIPF